MVTQEIFDNLKALQDILVQKNEFEAKDAAAPKQLQTQEEMIVKYQKAYIDDKAEYDSTKEKIEKLKVELEQAVQSREEGEKGVANSTTHREYEALEKQINEAKLKEENVRHELQKEEKELAGLNEKMNSTESILEGSKKEYEENKKSIDAERAQYKKEIDSLTAKEKEITPNLDQEIVFKLQRIIQRNTEGIVSVRNGVCTGCHMILPANFANEVREGDSIKFCPYCSRILVYEEVAEDQAEDFFNMGAVGSLAGLDDDFEDEEAEYGDESEEKDEFDENEELDVDEDAADEDLDEDDADEESDEDSDEE